MRSPRDHDPHEGVLTMNGWPASGSGGPPGKLETGWPIFHDVKGVSFLVPKMGEGWMVPLQVFVFPPRNQRKPCIL